MREFIFTPFLWEAFWGRENFVFRCFVLNSSQPPYFDILQSLSLHAKVLADSCVPRQTHAQKEGTEAQLSLWESIHTPEWF